MGFDLPVMNRLRRSGRALSPASLFSTGAQGVIYDPRDLSTMFQESTGTTPVTAPGQVVGLRLDKSKGGPGPELVSNGDFSNGQTGWTDGPTTPSGWTFAGGVCSGAGAAGGYQNVGQVVSGKTYVAEFTISNYVNGSLSLINSVVGAFGTVFSGNGVMRQVFTAGATGTIGFIRRTTNFTGTIDNFSVRELPGNHAVQATSGARLTYGIEPKTGTRNLLTYSEDFSNGIWGKTSATVTTNTAVAPDGTTTADLIQFTGAPGASQTVYGYDTRTGAHTVSFYVKANTAGGVGQTVRIDSTGAGANAVVATLTAEWQRYSIAINPTGYFQYRVISAAGNTATELLLWGAQLETGAVATAYQKVVTAFEVTEAGVPTCHYCAYAGANGMATPSIDFTATDKMSVFAGMRKTSDAAEAIALELNTTYDTGNGAFALFAPGGISAARDSAFVWASKGTLKSFTGPLAAAFPAPTTNVLTALGDIAGDVAAIRVNGTQVASSSADQGTGNFGNYTLNIGRRSGGTLPFTGRDYGIVIVGKAASAAEINITEAWLAANTPTVVL